MKYTTRTIPRVMHANCGHGNHRKLEDCVRLNFISAGQGDEEDRKPDVFGRQIRNLIVGDILAVYRTTVGYVGIAKVISNPIDIYNAVLGGQKVTSSIFSPDSDMFDNHDNDYREWLVEIKWLTTVHLGEQKGSGACYGIFPTQAVTCSLDNQQFLKQELQKAFRLDFNALLNSKFNIQEDDDETSFPEGKESFRLHKSKERNKDLVRLAKERHLKKDEKLCCQVCGFSFVDTYGEVGQGYIEAHHIFPISQLTEQIETKIEDLALVCSNCHRMLHRRRPWLTLDNLRAIRQGKN
jgi:HNH endonuclease